METVALWRPKELALVEASGWREWPPRLPDQPIFYPVLNFEYATMIARDWNVKVDGAGFVTRFRVRKAIGEGLHDSSDELCRVLVASLRIEPVRILGPFALDAPRRLPPLA